MTKKLMRMYRKARSYHKKINHKFNLCQRIFDSIIMVVIATIISTEIVDYRNNNRLIAMQRNELLDNLEMITTGCSKQWMDDVFGTPVFTNTDGITEEYVYITNIAVIRSFFDPEEKMCKMFFITKTTDEPIPFVPTLNNVLYNNTGSKQMLGTITYDQIKNGNLYIFDAIGYFTNGSGRTFYGEGFSPFYGYLKQVYFASVDYGSPPAWDLMGDIYSGKLSEEERNYYKEFLAWWMTDLDLLDEQYILHQRGEFYPNTYGLSDLGVDYTMEKLSDYNTFDSIELAYK